MFFIRAMDQPTASRVSSHANARPKVLYIVRKGLIVWGARLYSVGEACGEDAEQEQGHTARPHPQ